ncbi:unnamed protein product, partial [Ectocarpus sp. 4 AP-2014]
MSAISIFVGRVSVRVTSPGTPKLYRTLSSLRRTTRDAPIQKVLVSFVQKVNGRALDENSVAVARRGTLRWKPTPFLFWARGLAQEGSRNRTHTRLPAPPCLYVCPL